MAKIILTLLAIAICTEATLDVGLLLKLLKHHKHPKPKFHHPLPLPPPPPHPPVNYYLVPTAPAPVAPAPRIYYYYVQRPVPVTTYVASYYRHPVSPPADIPRFPPISQSTATASADSVTVEAQQQPLSFTQVGTKQAEQATPIQPQQSLSLPFAESGPSFSVETAKSESHSFALQPEPLNLDQSQTSDTIEVQPEEEFDQEDQ